MQCGFARAGFADDVHVRGAVGTLDTEATMLVAEVGFGKDGDSVVSLLRVHRSKLPVGNQQGR